MLKIKDLDRFFAVTLDRVMHRHVICLVSQLYGTSLRGILNNHDVCPIPPHQARVMIWQIFKAVNCKYPSAVFLTDIDRRHSVMHSLCVIHTDLKPENIVLVDDTLIKIRDVDDDGNFFDRVRGAAAFCGFTADHTV